MTTEQRFMLAADTLLAALGAALDAALGRCDADVDWSLNDGILTIECADGGKIIVNRHLPNREIWVAARSGAFHFRADGDAWRDTRSTRGLAETLTRLLAEHAGLSVDLAAMPPPGPDLSSGQ